MAVGWKSYVLRKTGEIRLAMQFDGHAPDTWPGEFYIWGVAEREEDNSDGYVYLGEGSAQMKYPVRHGNWLVADLQTKKLLNVLRDGDFKELFRPYSEGESPEEPMKFTNSTRSQANSALGTVIAIETITGYYEDDPGHLCEKLFVTLAFSEEANKLGFGDGKYLLGDKQPRE